MLAVQSIKAIPIHQVRAWANQLAGEARDADWLRYSYVVPDVLNDVAQELEKVPRIDRARGATRGRQEQRIDGASERNPILSAPTKREDSFQVAKGKGTLRDSSEQHLLVSFGNSQGFLQGPYVECCIGATIPD